jgi:hypothetical protein
MPKPRNWKQIAAIREAFWKEVFDDVNASFDEISQKTLALIDEKRKELQTLLLEEAHCYKQTKEKQEMKPCYLARYQPVKVIEAGRKADQYKPIEDCSKCWTKNNCARWRERNLA